jgi:carboxymethylenebutenolidase
MVDAIQAETIALAGGNGDRIEAYVARPLGGSPHGSVIVVHHLPGYDPASKEITRNFAVEGYTAICPNLYSREAPGVEWREAAATARAAGGVSDDQMLADVAAAAEHLRARDDSNGKVGIIGYCSGGRQAVMAACRLELDAVVDCYGAFVMRTAGADTGLPRQGFPELIPQLSCPLLGLFGEEDPAPPVDEVRELEKALDESGKDFRIRIFEDAGHAFFSVDSQKYRPKAAMAGWQEIVSFYARCLT